MIGIKEIWIEAEERAIGEWNPEDDNTDVIVTIDDYSKYIATFFTYNNIQSLVEKNKKTGECMNGSYFWASEMILIESCSRQRIEKVIEHLILDDEFEQIFKKIKAENNGEHEEPL